MENKINAITSPKGFRAAGIHCGLKKTTDPDIALILSDVPATVAGVYTQNLVKGHSLVRTISLVKKNASAKGVVINSGNANACVGAIGLEDANTIAELVASNVGCTSSDILTCSTGVIGYRLDMESIKSSIPTLTKALDYSEEAGHKAMAAIMTTDLVPKESTATIEIGGTVITISAMAKGSGMIHPNLATMISIITTDANIPADLLQAYLSRAVSHTFNRVSVDGDTSVCDTLLILANGAANNAIWNDCSDESQLFQSALTDICTDLSRMIAKDGEGATKLIEVEVVNALSEKDAYLSVLSVCRSPLCKTTIFGEDANWGRVLTALGYSGAFFDPEKVDIFFGNVQVCKNGCALPFDEILVKEILMKDEILITIDCHMGHVYDRMWTCDFSYDYVKINGSYRS